MELKKATVARWESKRGKYWVELTVEYLPDCAPAFSYRSDNGGGYLGHCAPEVAMQRSAQEAGYAPSKMTRVTYNWPIDGVLIEQPAKESR